MGGAAGGAFSKATFAAEEGDEGGGPPQVDDPPFWAKLLPERATRRAQPEALDRAARRHRGTGAVARENSDFDSDEDVYITDSDADDVLDACEAALRKKRVDEKKAARR